MIESIWSWFLHKYKQDCLGSFIIILNLPKLIMKKNYIFVQFNLFVFSIWYNSTYIFTIGILLEFTYINSHPFSRKYIPEFIWNRRKDYSSEGKFKIIFFFWGKCSMFAFCSCSFIHKSQKVTSGQGELQALPPHDLVKSWKQFKWTQPIT